MKASSHFPWAMLVVALAATSIFARGESPSGRTSPKSPVIIVTPGKTPSKPSLVKPPPGKLASGMTSSVKPPLVILPSGMQPSGMAYEGNQLVPALPGEIVAPLPLEITRPLPQQVVRTLSGQIVRPLPGQIVQPLPGQIVPPLPGQIVR